MSQDIEVLKLEELSPDKIYHLTLAPDAGEARIQAFALAIKELGLRALISRGEVNIEHFADMFKKLTPDRKQLLLDNLRSNSVEIDPTKHEQTK